MPPPPPPPLGKTFPTARARPDCKPIENNGIYQSNTFPVTRATDDQYNALICLQIPIEFGLQRKVSIYCDKIQSIGVEPVNYWIEFYLRVGVNLSTEPVANGIYKATSTIQTGLVVDFEKLIFNTIELYARLDPTTANEKSSLNWMLQIVTSPYGGSIGATYGELVEPGK